MNLFRRSIIILVFALAPVLRTSGQSTELQLHIHDVINQQVPGKAILTSPDSTWVSYHQGDAVFVLGKATGMDMPQVPHLKVYPNPADRELVIETQTTDKGKYLVSDMTGRVLAEIPATQTSFLIPPCPSQLLLIHYQEQGNSRSVGKVISTGNAIHVKLISQQPRFKASFSPENDHYQLLLEANDSLEYEDLSENGIYLPPGTSQQLTLTHQYTAKDYLLQFRGIGSGVHIDIEAIQSAIGNTDTEGNTDLYIEGGRISKNTIRPTKVKYSGQNTTSENYVINLKPGINNSFLHAEFDFQIQYEGNLPGGTFSTIDAEGNDITGGTFAREDSIASITQALLEGYTAEPVEQWIKKGENIVQAYFREIGPDKYLRSVAGKIVSDSAEIKPGSELQLLGVSDQILKAYTDSQGNFKFEDYLTLDSVATGRLLGAFVGHDSMEVAVTIDERTETLAELEATTTQYERAQLPVHVYDADQGDAEGAAISVLGMEKFGNAQGLANFDIELQTDKYNALTDNYVTAVANTGNADHNFYEEVKKEGILLQQGLNPQIELEVRYENRFHLFSNLGSTPNMNPISIWEGGEALRITTSNAEGSYKTTDITRTSLTYNPDSVSFEKTGMLSQTKSPVLTDGGNELDVILGEVPPTYFDRNVSFQLVSDEKEIKPGTQAQLQGVTQQALIAYTDANGWVRFEEYTTIDSIGNAKILASAVGHKELNVSVTVDEENENLGTQEVQADIYQAAQVNLHVQDLDQGNTEGALCQVEGMSLENYTNANGITSFSLPSPTTEYNELEDLYVTFVTSTGNASHTFNANARTENVQLFPGTNPQINQIVEYINTFFAWSANSTANMHVKLVANGETRETDSDGNGDYETGKITSTALTVQGTIEGTKANHEKFEDTRTLHDGGDRVDITLTPTIVNTAYIVDVTLTDHQGKIPLSGRLAVVYQGDTIDAENFTGNSKRLEFEHEESSLNSVSIIAKDIPYFEGGVASDLTLDGDDDVSLAANSIIVQYSMSGHAEHENGDEADGNVSFEGKNANTDANGNYSIGNIVVEANLNNVPQVPSAKTATISSPTSAFPSKNRSVTVTGENLTGINFSVDNLIQTYNYPVDIILSNDDGKTELGFEGYIKVNGEEVKAQTFTGTSGRINITTNEELSSLVAGARSISYFSDGIEKTVNNPNQTDNDAIVVTDTDKTYFDASGRVTHDNGEAADADVNFHGKSDDTDSNGYFNINNILLKTGQNNQPITPYNETATVSGNGFNNEEQNVSVTGENITGINFNVDDIGTTYTLNIGHTDLRLDNWISSGTFHVRTMSDGKEHTFPISSGVQGFDITGDYTDGTGIKMWTTDVAGYETLVSTFVRSREQPITSNGTRSDTATSTLGALDYGTVFNALMNTSRMNDADFKARVNGGMEWTGNNGSRYMNLFMSTERRVSDGTGDNGGDWADNLTADELNGLHERVALFENFMSRGTGYEAMNVEKTVAENYEGQSPYNKVFINFDERNEPGNGPPYGGDTYNYRNSHVRNWFDIITLSTEFYEAVVYPTEVGGGSSGLVGHSGFTPYLTTLGEDIAMVNFTYKGGEAPK